MNRRSLLTTAALASASILSARGAVADTAPPAAVEEALKGYGDLSPTVSYLLDYSGPRGQWQTGFNAHAVQFVGSAIKTFILAQTLRDAEQDKLSENDQWAVDDAVRSLSSPVFFNLTGTTTARSVLEAMIAHSDNTATDIALAKAKPDRVRALVAEAGLTQTHLAESTRRMFSYLAGAPAGVDLGWAGVEKAESGTMPGPPRAALNDRETMVSTSEEMVRWYRQALTGKFFAKPETLAEFKRIQAMADAIPLIVPANVLGFGKGGSIDWDGFHCIAVAGQMVSGSATVTFSFILNWTGDNKTIIGNGVSYMKKALAAAAGEFTA
ncbi:MAG: serine hydrolase [Proteobacteria bacterium]|nr:serine hydrolase [Pseudomonadota bacterium]